MKIVCLKAKRILCGIGLLALALAVCILLREVGAYAVNAMTAARALPIYCVEREDKKIAISFDCAWGIPSLNMPAYWNTFSKPAAETLIARTPFGVYS